LFKLKNLVSLRLVLHKPLLKKEEEELKGVGGGLVELEVQPSSLDPICPVLQAAGPFDVVQHVGARYLMSFHLVSVRDFSHTFVDGP
jgi:hypothetical protein